MRRFKGYIANHNGVTTGEKSGNFIRYKTGELIACMEGDLDHVGAGMVPVYEEGGVSSAAPAVETADMRSADVETRPVKPTRKRRASTAKK